MKPRNRFKATITVIDLMNMDRSEVEMVVRDGKNKLRVAELLKVDLHGPGLPAIVSSRTTLKNGFRWYGTHSYPSSTSPVEIWLKSKFADRPLHVDGKKRGNK